MNGEDKTQMEESTDESTVGDAMTESEMDAGTVPAEDAVNIRVRATRDGYSDGRRRPGDIFRIPTAKAFSKNWMELAGEGEAPDDNNPEYIAQVTLKKAQTEAKSIIERAKEHAKKLLAGGAEIAGEVLEAKEQAEVIIKEAVEKAKVVAEEAKVVAEKMAEEAHHVAEGVIEEAKAAAIEIKAEAEKVLDEATSMAKENEDDLAG